MGGLPDLPFTFERFAILPMPANQRFIDEFAEEGLKTSRGKTWAPGWEPNKPGAFQQSGDHLMLWALHTVMNMQATFMQLVHEYEPQVDAYAVDTTIHQIERFVDFVAFSAVQLLQINLGTARNLSIDKNIDELYNTGCMTIVHEVRKFTVLWTDAFREWAEPRRQLGGPEPTRHPNDRAPNNRQYESENVTGAPPDLISSATAVAKFHVSRPTLCRLIRRGELTDHRPANHRSNAPFLIDRHELARKYPPKPSR